MLRVLAVLCTLCLITAGAAVAGSPHFVRCSIVGGSPTSITVAAKEAGLGDEAQIEVLLTADAQCINPGGKPPAADNKDEVATGATIPVQNGQASYQLTGTATFQPECSPPMSVVFSNVLITDLTHNLTCVP